MIAYLKGKILHVNEEVCILLNNDVGYEIFTTEAYKFKINDVASFYIYQHVKEDANILYGFLSLELRDLYIKLLSVKGVGPKLALSILGNHTANDIYNALKKEDVNFFRSISGIGKKAAGQIILDLKGNLATNSFKDSLFQEVEKILLSLGYKSNEVKKVYSSINITDKNKEDIVKECLLNLYRN